MKATEARLLDFLKKSPQFVIPEGFVGQEYIGLYPRVRDIGVATPALGIVANTPPRDFPIENLVSSTFTRSA